MNAFANSYLDFQYDEILTRCLQCNKTLGCDSKLKIMIIFILV